MKNKFSIALAVVLFASINATAQSTQGITGKPDTSYTTYSDYKYTIKNHPYIKIVPELTSPAISEKKGIVYCKVGERELLLDAFYPSKKTKAKKPVVMIIHGGGWRSGNRTQHYPLAQHLASLGYVCFTPEYRLSTEALYPAAVHDLKAALRWIHANAKSYNIDTSRIAVAGFSAGGELAAFLGTTTGNSAYEGTTCYTNFSSNVQAIVDMDGTLSFVHPESAEGDDSKRTSAATYWFGYPKKDASDLWKDASPLAHVSRFTPPTLFINSSVKHMHAGRTDYLNALKENNIYAEVKSFDDAPHSFPLYEPWFEPMLETIDIFLKKVFSETKKKD